MMCFFISGHCPRTGDDVAFFIVLAAFDRQLVFNDEVLVFMFLVVLVRIGYLVLPHLVYPVQQAVHGGEDHQYRHHQQAAHYRNSIISAADTHAQCSGKPYGRGSGYPVYTVGTAEDYART